MAVKFLGDGEGFSFPSSFGFSRSASKTAVRMPDDNRAEAVRPATEFTPRDPGSMNSSDRSYQRDMRAAVEREPYARGGAVSPGRSPALGAQPLTRQRTAAPMPGNALARGALGQAADRSQRPMRVSGAVATAPVAAAPSPAPDMQEAAGMKRGGAIAIKPSHKGFLHKDLGIPAGQPIPTAKLQAAKNSSDPAVRKRATFAENARGWK